MTAKARSEDEILDKIFDAISLFKDKQSCEKVIRNGFMAAMIWTAFVGGLGVAATYYHFSFSVYGSPRMEFFGRIPHPMLLDGALSFVLGILILRRNLPAAVLMILFTAIKLILFHQEVVLAILPALWYLAALRAVYIWRRKYGTVSAEAAAGASNEEDQISLDLAKADYTGGDTVEGTLTVNLATPAEVRGILVHIAGWEHACWGGGKNSPRHDVRRDLFAETLTLFGNPESSPLEQNEGIGDLLGREHRYEVLQPGTYKYPFSYKLPPDLPADFDVEVKDRSCISYLVSGRVDIPFLPDLSCSRRLNVYQKLDAGALRSASVERSVSANNGRFEVRAVLDREVFCPGDTITGTFVVTNYLGKHINAVTVELTRVVDLIDKESRAELSRKIHSGELAVPEGLGGQLAQIPIRIPLPEDLYGSVSATELVRVRYELVFRVNVRWARDLELTVPVTIVERAGLPPDASP
ncbi:MAG: arrestin family protein [Syntrophobacteraceae bacterium]